MSEKHESRAIPAARLSPYESDSATRVADAADIHARRIRLHNQLVRKRRWSKELDRLCGRGAA